MKNRKADKLKEMPFIYYRTKGEIVDYLKKPTELKLQWLEAQMEFFHKAMPLKAKKIRERLQSGDWNDERNPKPDLQSC